MNGTEGGGTNIKNEQERIGRLGGRLAQSCRKVAGFLLQMLLACANAFASLVVLRKLAALCDGYLFPLNSACINKPPQVIL
jgi:hypothetical protein